MFPTANPPSVSAYLLNEIATSGTFPDPVLFVYGTVGILSIVFLTLAYLAIGRPRGVATRAKTDATPLSGARLSVNS